VEAEAVEAEAAEAEVALSSGAATAAPTIPARVAKRTALETRLILDMKEEFLTDACEVSCRVRT
jgi:hypothetical protein